MNGPPDPMTRVTQTITVGDGSGKRGNCLQAAVASWFGREVDEVPDFANVGPIDAGGYAIWWQELLWGYFARAGWLLRLVGLHERPLPDERCLVFGDSPRGGGISHIVVAEGGEIVWDPHPSGDGLAVVRGAYVAARIDDLSIKARAWDEREAA